MSIITTPLAAVPNTRRDTVRLVWSGDSRTLNGEYRIRGGICWPYDTGVGQDSYHGFAVVVGERIISDVASERIVFSECQFSAAETVFDETTGRVYPGLLMWLSDCWARYCCGRYYWSQDEYTFTVWLRRMREIDHVGRRYLWTEVDVPDGNSAQQVVAEHEAAGRLKVRAGGLFARSWNEHKATPWGARAMPAVMAVACALAGMDRSPWRAPSEDTPDIVLMQGGMRGMPI